MRSMQSPPISRTRANVLGVGIDALNMRTAVSAIDAALASGHKGYVCVTGVHGIMEAQTDEHLRTILNNSFLTTPDGMPTVWVGKWQGFRGVDRVYGPLSEELVRTLDVLAECDFDRGQAATALPTHRNTLRNRLVRVHELTGVDVDTVEGRALTTLAWLSRRGAPGAAPAAKAR